jgi:cobalt-zinc-cadmium efflux system outer membrane protein
LQAQKKKYMKAKLLLFFSLILIKNSFSQVSDTLVLSLPEAEKTFLQNNLLLIASRYNIDANTALIRQAKLWDNPVLLTDQNLYDGKFFRHKMSPDGQNSGQVYIQIQELIRTAGKIRKLTDLATTNAKISGLQFEQVMQNLRYTLRSDYYQTTQLLYTIDLYEQENSQMKKLLQGMQAQLQAGNISQKDFLRIQGLQLSVLQEENDFKKQLADVQAELRSVLQINKNVFIKPVLSEIRQPVLAMTLDSLIASAKQHNPEYLLEQTNLTYQKQNLRYQQALRSPDVTVGVEYDKASSYTPNFYGLTIALPLPVINRNQGNIAAAGYNVKQEQTLLSQKEQKLINDLQNVLTKFQLNTDLIKATDPDFIRKYNQLMQNAFRAYQQRQMNLLDFVDLFEAYKEAQLKYLQQQFDLQKQAENINLLAGKDVINQ